MQITFIPLDERPCNYEFPYMLVQGTEHQVDRPPLSMMGQKKTPGDWEQLWTWLEEKIETADGAVIALDTLLYGGIIPSRLHYFSETVLLERLNRLRKIKEKRPELKLLAFQLIMRCPQYSISDEEPDYYADWGREIFRKGYISHRKELNIATQEELQELSHIESRLPNDVLSDYLGRRKINMEANKAVLDLVKDGVIDFLIFPQDDSAPYGYTAKDQQVARQRIGELDLELVAYMYPGADEVGCTLMTRLINEWKGVQPLVYPRLSSIQGAFVTPVYEDRFFYETLKYQITAAGALIASSAAEADLVLLASTPGETMMEAVSQEHPFFSYDVYRNLMELVEYGSYLLKQGKAVAVADVGYANGADLKLLKMLRQKEMLFQLAGYAAWNTSSNTLGTVISQALLYTHYGRTQEHLDFLALRYAEDAGYCAVVRKELNAGLVDQMGYNKFLLDGPRGKVAAYVRDRLADVFEEKINGPEGKITITDCYMPWNRTFEVGLKVKYDAAQTD